MGSHTLQDDGKGDVCCEWKVEVGPSYANTDHRETRRVRRTFRRDENEVIVARNTAPDSLI
jgi:hypothetical protein